MDSSCLCVKRNILKENLICNLLMISLAQLFDGCNVKSVVISSTLDTSYLRQLLPCLQLQIRYANGRQNGCPFLLK